MDKKDGQGLDLEEVLISSRATDEDLEAGLLNSSSNVVDSQGQIIETQKQRSSVKRNVSELGQRVRESFKGQSDAPAAGPSKSVAPAHPVPPKSAMKRQAGMRTEVARLSFACCLWLICCHMVDFSSPFCACVLVYKCSDCQVRNAASFTENNGLLQGFNHSTPAVLVVL